MINYLLSEDLSFLTLFMGVMFYDDMTWNISKNLQFSLALIIWCWNRLIVDHLIVWLLLLAFE